MPRAVAADDSRLSTAYCRVALSGGLSAHRDDSHPGRHRFSGLTRNGRYSWARYYHPGLARFISEDPIGFAGGDINLYAYVSSQPTTVGDPLGLAHEGFIKRLEEMADSGVLKTIKSKQETLYEHLLKLADARYPKGILHTLRVQSSELQLALKEAAKRGLSVAKIVGRTSGIVGAVILELADPATAGEGSDIVPILGSRK